MNLKTHKFIFSGYGTINNTLALYSFTNSGKIQLDSKDFVSPSFVTGFNKYIYTYEKHDGVMRLISLYIDDKIKIIDTFTLNGSSITHLVYSKKHNLLFGCSYADGTFFSIKVINGRFIKLIQLEKQIKTDELSRCHCVFLNEEETELGIVNIALDKIFMYKIDNDSLVFLETISVKHDEDTVNVGPRHAFIRKEKIYCVSEYSNELIIIDRQEKKIVKSVSTIPNFNGISYGATLCLSKDEKFIYCSNRGEDSIAVFNLDGEYIRNFSCYGEHPRHMIISKDGTLLISCNKNSNNIAIIDIKTERLIESISFTQPSGVFEL